MKQFLIACLVVLMLPSAQSIEISDHLTITHQGETIAIVNRENFFLPLPGIPMLDTNKFDQFAEELDQQIYTEPVNANINEQGEINPEKLGYRLHKKEFQNQFYTYFV